MTDATRCPECDYALMKAPASSVRMWVGPPGGFGSRRLNPVDVIYCDRCGWCRFATANDHSILDVLLRRREEHRHRAAAPAPSGIEEIGGGWEVGPCYGMNGCAWATKDGGSWTHFPSMQDARRAVLEELRG